MNRLPRGQHLVRHHVLILDSEGISLRKTESLFPEYQRDTRPFILESIDRAAHVAETGIGQVNPVFTYAFEHREMPVGGLFQMNDDGTRQSGQGRKIELYSNRLVTHSFRLQPQIEK